LRNLRKNYWDGKLSETDQEAWGVSFDAKVHIVGMVAQQSQNAAIKWRKLHN